MSKLASCQDVNFKKVSSPGIVPEDKGSDTEFETKTYTIRFCTKAYTISDKIRSYLVYYMAH